MSEMAISAAKSAAPNAEFALASRTDPYYSGLSESGANAAWLSQAIARRHNAAGLQRIPTALDIPQQEAIGRISQNGTTLQRALNVLAALNTWRTLTGEQIAAITGTSGAASARSTLMPELFAAGLVDIGVISNALGRTPPLGRTTLFRPSSSTVFEKELTPHLTYPEWVSVTGGHGWDIGKHFDRHDILAAELCLRVAELCEVGVVLGEKFSTIDLLAHSGLGHPKPYGSNGSADATLIRADGARIAIELTASTGPHFKAKIRRWAELIGSRLTSDSGLHVVFVLAPNLSKGLRQNEYLLKARDFIREAARDYTGWGFDRTASRMFVATWADWFPRPDTVDNSFLTLDAYRPTGPFGATWERAAILDPIDTPFRPREGTWNPLAVIDNAAMLRSVPTWLRTGNAPELWPSAVKKLGFNRIPVTEPTKPWEYVGLPLGAGSGVAGQTLAPRRLRAKPNK